MDTFMKLYKTYQTRINNKKMKEANKEEQIKKYQEEYKQELIKNKGLYEKKIDKAINIGYSKTDYIESQSHFLGVHYSERFEFIERNGEEAWDKELKKREEATLKCKALQRLVKDINRHEDFETRLIYEENIDYCNPVDNSVVECGIYFDWSLKNNLKFMNDKIIGKII